MAQPSPPPPAPYDAPPPSPEGAATKWNGSDLLLIFLCSIAFGIVAAASIFTALRAFDVEPSTTSQVGMAGVSIYAVVLIAAWIFVVKRRGATAEEIGFKWVGIGPVLLAIPILLGLMAVTYVILTATELLVGGVPTAQEQVAPDEARLYAADLVWLLLAGSVAAPIAEELYFRGLMFRYLRSQSGFITALLVSSALFALFHVTPPLMPALFVFGIVQALVMHRFDSLYPAILLHALNNAVLMVLVYAQLS